MQCAIGEFDVDIGPVTGNPIRADRTYQLADSIRRNESASKIDPPPNFTSGFDPSPRKRSDFSTSVLYDGITGCHEGDGVRPRNIGEPSSMRT